LPGDLDCGSAGVSDQHDPRPGQRAWGTAPKRRPDRRLGAHARPLLIGIRVAIRRARRIALSAISTAITVSAVVAVLIAHATSDQQSAGSGGPNDPAPHNSTRS
jgi:hypothetical protein